MASRVPRAYLGALALVAAAAGGRAHAAGDVFDQFFRYADSERRAVFAELPGETVDPFTGTLRLVQQDLVLPGKAGLDFRVIRSYSSKIWGRSDLLDAEPLLAEKEHSLLGYGWTFHFGRLRNPNGSGASGTCSGDFPVFEDADGTARVFYPLTGSNTVFVSKDYWRLEKQCAALGGTGACVWSDTGVRYEISNSFNNQYFYGLTPIWPVSAKVDRFDNRISYSYVQDQSGTPSSATDTYNRVVTFSYVTATGDGRRLDKVTANGAVYQYTYTTYTSAQTGGAGRLPLPGSRRFLTRVTPPAGPAYQYSYAYNAAVSANQYALSTITYPAGGTTTYGYGPVTFFTGRENVPFSAVTNRVVAGRAVTSGTWSYSYAPAAKGTALDVTTITRPDGKHDVHSMYGFGYVAGRNATGYTWLVGLTHEISRGDGAQIETLTWDARDDAPVSPAVYGAPIYGGCGVNYVWDVGVNSPALASRTVERDGATFSSTYSSFDGYGQPRNVDESSEQAVGVSSRTTALTYSSVPTNGSGATLNLLRGRPMTRRTCIEADCDDDTWTYNGYAYSLDRETVRGVETRFAYGTDGNLATVTNALNQTLTLSGYATGYGIPTTLNFNGAYPITRTAYWEGRLKSETNGRSYTTSYTYDLAGRLKSVTPPGVSAATTYEFAPDGSSVTLTRSRYTKTTAYDGLGRETATSDGVGVLTSKKYDSMGRTWFESYPYSTATGEVGEKRVFDGLGRVTTRTKAYRPATSACDVVGACLVTVSYSDNCTTTTEDRKSGDRPSTQRCDRSFGDPDEHRLARVLDANAKSWSYSHDTFGNVTSVTAPLAGGSRSYSYDPMTHFLETETSPERGTTTFDPNAIGQPRSRVDARGIKATYGYNDPLSRLRSTTYGAGSGDDVSLDYDNADNVKSLTSTNGGSFVNTYDEVNRLKSQQWTFMGRTYTTSLSYDAAGCLYSITYPSGLVVGQECDTANRVTSITIGRSNVVKTATYHASGQVATMSFGNGKSTTIVYDDRARMRSATATGVLGLQYGYDGAGNVTSFDNTVVSGASRTMSYDALDRIITSTAPYLWGTSAFDYDELGNRKLNSVGSYTTTYTYDANNRLATADSGLPLASMAFTWDVAGRLETSSDGASYAYDGRGRRVRKTDASGTVVYHYDASGRVLAEMLPDGTKVRDYVYLANRLVAVDGCAVGLPPACTSGRQWYHTDALGSVLARTDASGTVVARLDYQAWGEQWSPTVPSEGRQYNGRVFDPGTGFHDYRARMYWPEVGRFISPDTYGGDPANPATLNRYAYVQNNPYKYIDPTGHFAWLPWTMGIGAVGGGLLAAKMSTNTGWDYFTDILGGIGMGGLAGTGVGLIADAVLAPRMAQNLQNAAQQVEARAPVVEGESAAAGQEIGMLRAAAQGKGNFGVGSTDAHTANRLGRAWVGEGASTAADGSTLVSGDKLRQFRPPSWKPNLGRVQANLEGRTAPEGKWQSNAHIDIQLGPDKP